jgi:haloalkane dehalogenase
MTTSFDVTRMLPVGGLDIAYREVGPADGQPVLLVHGWPLSSRTWRKVAPALSERGKVRCIAVDLPGAGETRCGPACELGLGTQARHLANFTDALGLRRHALVGHDSGGSVARGLAVMRPERVSHLVLADTEVPGHRPPQMRALSLMARLPTAPRLLALLLGSRRLARSPAGFASCFADVSQFDFDEFFQAVLKPNASSPERLAASHGFLRAFDLGEVDRLRSQYGSLRMPKCLIWGERDALFPIKHGRRLLEMLPGPALFHSVPDTGAFVHEERPDAWVEVVREFLAAHHGQA